MSAVIVPATRSAGQRARCVTRAVLATLFAALAMPAAHAGAQPAAPCPCDCRGEGRVTIDDLILAVRVALGSAAPATCPAADRNGNGAVEIAELIAGVGAALSGCPATPTPTASGTAAPPTASATAAPPTATETPSMTVASATPTSSPTPSVRPNFLVIELDDTRHDGLDRMAQLQTRLLPESVTFDSGFVPFASCASSRASLLSGLYAVHHGTRNVAGAIGGAKTFRQSGADQQTVAVWLQNAGYATGLFGKYINEYDAESDRGPGGGYYIPPGWTRWLAFPVEHYGGLDGPDYDLVDEHGVVTHYDDHTTDAQYSTDVTADAVRQFIQDSSEDGRPFFAYWAPYASHDDGAALTPIPAAVDLNALADLLSPAELFRPPNWAEPDRSDKPRWDSTILQFFTPDHIAILEEGTDQIRERAYETLLDVDRQLGALLDQLDALGIADRTVVLLTSDNGVAWGEHAQFFQTKSCPYEECLRVPLMIHVPSLATTGALAAPALNIDIAPTIADLAGVPIPTAIDGQSLLPVLTNPSESIRDDFLLEQWREVRGATIVYDGQPSDGDRLELFYGPGLPKVSATFEFDSGDGVGSNSIPVVIQATADATFQALGAAAHASIPHTAAFAVKPVADPTLCPHPPAACKQLTLSDTSAALTGLYWWQDVNQSGNFRVDYPVPDFFGVRDARNGFTYVQYEDREVELYDLNADPWQLNNVADDPSYAATRATLDARMRELAGIP